MMIKPRFFLNLSLLAVLLASCAPAAVTELPVAQPVAVEPTLVAPADTVAVATEAVAPAPPAIATSRGPDLEATDPQTVSLASGGLQVVEFFRFT